MFHFARSLQAGSEESRHRSDILKPLIWPVGLCLAAAVSLAAVGGPPLLIGLLSALSVLFLLLYGGCFIFFAIKSPDQLRSESYTLRKMAIEKGLAGDSATGLAQISSVSTSGDLGESVSILTNVASDQQ